MAVMEQHPASYRDPAGHVHLRDGRVYRTVLPAGVAHYRAARETGFLEAAAREGKLIRSQEVDPSLIRGSEPDTEYLLEHPRLEFISHPYEWSFHGLKDAALLTLDLHLDALDHGLTLSDASAYNVQFVGPRPIFIDLLSVIRYEEGQIWLGYRQFCEQFLNPLLLTAKTGVSFQPWYRGSLEGISSADLAALLPGRSRIDPRVLLHVSLQSRMQRSITVERAAAASRVRLSRSALVNNIRSMRNWVAKLEPLARVTAWQDYERTAHYTDAERSAKVRFVSSVVRDTGARTVWDLGCNSGEYAEHAIENGADSVIGFEPDPGALNAAYQRAKSKGLRFLPLAMDLANPSPSLGWRQSERQGLDDRRNADVILCLALLHHLVLGRNLPMDQVIDWLVSLAPAGVIEFVPKDDPMARQLLTFKPHVGADYECETFVRLLERRARVERKEVVTESGRTLVAFSRQ